MSWHASDEQKIMASFAIQPMESSGNISMTTTVTLPANQGMLGSHCIQMEWIHLLRGAASIAHGRWFPPSTTYLHGWCRSENTFCYPYLSLDQSNLELTWMFSWSHWWRRWKCYGKKVFKCWTSIAKIHSRLNSFLPNCRQLTVITMLSSWKILLLILSLIDNITTQYYIPTR